MSAQPIVREKRARAPRLGFVGLGWIGRRRLDAIAGREDVRVAALFDADTERLESSAAQYKDAIAHERIDTLLEQELDGIVIATPNAMHANQAVACLTRGVPVFCQKPLATDAGDTARVIEAARQADRLLAVDYSYRHVRGMAELRERIAAGDLGAILAIDLEFHNAYAPNKQWCFDRAHSGGGCLLDLGIHLIDLALWLQHAPPTRVTRKRLFAQGRPATRESVEDLAFIELEQEGGGLVRIACSWNAQIGCDAQIGMQLHGTRGGAAWRNIDGSFLNFHLWHCRGNQRELLGASYDDWGTGALSAWIDRLNVDCSFDPSAFDILAGARLIDEAYHG